MQRYLLKILRQCLLHICATLLWPMRDHQTQTCSFFVQALKLVKNSFIVVLNRQLNPKYPVADFLCYITCVCLSTLIEALYLESYDVTVAQCMIGIPQAIHYPIVLQIFARITTEDKLSD